MGTTFSTIQIQNRQQLEPDQFVKSLSKYMAKKGLTPTTEENAQFSYRISFSGDSNWITLSSTEYECTDINSEVEGIAKALKTCCIGTSVYDSDFLFLNLFDAPTKQRDTVAIGGDADDIEEMFGMEFSTVKGNPKCWNPLLAEGETWERLTEIWNEEYVFAEDALSEMAPLLGMDSHYIRTDYIYWDEVEPDDLSLINLHFQTSQPAFINEGPTKLAFRTMAFMVSGQPNHVTLYNVGGISKGLSIVLLGDCFINDEVEIKEISVEKGKDPRKKRNNWFNDLEIVSAQPEKKQFDEGRYGLLFTFDEFEFPEGLNMEHPSMNGKNGDDAIFSHQILLRFTATITSNKTQFQLFVIPQNNWKEGQVNWTIPVTKTHTAD